MLIAPRDNPTTFPCLGGLTLGSVPRVVGTLATREGLESNPPDKKTCDIVEARMDRIGLFEDWMNVCRRIEAGGTPVLVTLRLQLEGGQWTADDADRTALLTAALETLSSIDIEADSPACDALCARAAELNKPVVVSYHAFDGTPDFDTLAARIRTVQRYRTAIPKLATLTRDEADTAVLERLVSAFAATRPLCVLGMGPQGPRTRLALPRLGSALTYGYLDVPVAPGQAPAAQLSAALRASRQPDAAWRG